MHSHGPYDFCSSLIPNHGTGTNGLQVAILRGIPVYKVTSTDVLASLHVDSEDSQYVCPLVTTYDPASPHSGHCGTSLLPCFMQCQSLLSSENQNAVLISISKPTHSVTSVLTALVSRHPCDVQLGSVH